MRTIAIIVSLLATSSFAIVTVASRSIDAESRTSDNPYYTDIESTRDESLLEDFIASLDKDKIAEFVDGQDDIGLDNLAACGDFGQVKVPNIGFEGMRGQKEVHLGLLWVGPVTLDFPRDSSRVQRLG